MTTVDTTITPDTTLTPQAVPEVKPAHGVTLSETAAAKAKALLDRDGSSEMVLRIAVQPGGCSGLRYELFFDDRSLDGDALVDFGGIGLAVDRMSKPYLDGAVIDFVDTIEKPGFHHRQPQRAELLRLR